MAAAHVLQAAYHWAITTYMGLCKKKSFACGNNEIYVAICGGVVLKNYIRYGLVVERIWCGLVRKVWGLVGQCNEHDWR